MNLAQLKYAVEVEKTGSISQAAENLYMGQPNLSRALKELETSLRITIFKRTPKGVTPTETGKQFLRYAKNILTQIDELEHLYAPGNAAKQAFRICIPRSSYITYAFVQLVSSLDFMQEVELDICETNSVQSIHNIEEGTYNLAIIRYQVEHEPYFFNLLREQNLQSRTIWEFEYLLLMSTQHALAQKEQILFEDLTPYLEIAHGDISVPYPSNNAEQTAPKRRVYVYERGSQFDLLTHVPQSYIWVSPVPDETLARYSLVQRKCYSNMHRYRDVLIYPKNYKPNKLDQSFIDNLTAIQAQLAAKTYQ